MRMGSGGWLACLMALGMTGCFLDRSGTVPGNVCASALECDADEECVDMVCVRRVDAGRDAGRDAGIPDTGIPDDASRDAGIPDAGTDAGDAGTDAGVFSPSDIDGLVLWLRSDDLSLGEVATWADRSGSGNDATPRETVMAERVMGHTVVRTGGRAFLATRPFRWGDDATVFVVAAVDGDNGREQRLLSTNSDVHFAIMVRRDTARLELWISNTSSSSSSAPGQPYPPGWHIVTVEDATNVTNIWVDGIVLEDARQMIEIPDRTEALGVGGNPVRGDDILDGQFAEILIWNAALTATQRGQVESYLRRRWSGLGIP